MIIIALIVVLLIFIDRYLLRKYVTGQPINSTWVFAILFPINYLPISTSKILDDYLSEMIIALLEFLSDIFFPEEWSKGLKSINYWLVFGLLVLFSFLALQLHTIWFNKGSTYITQSASRGICCNLICLLLNDYIGYIYKFYLLLLLLCQIIQHFFRFRDPIHYLQTSSFYLLITAVYSTICLLSFFERDFQISSFMIYILFLAIRLGAMFFTLIYFLCFFITNIEHLVDYYKWFENYRSIGICSIEEILMKLLPPYGYVLIFIAAFYLALEFFNSSYQQIWLFYECLFLVGVGHFSVIINLPYPNDEVDRVFFSDLAGCYIQFLAIRYLLNYFQYPF
ncbi:unnamed protein product [Blepharisma stoltei]|uniref:Uncharacterized protein n=1 Tax=Blepharisma stoltei TaxID=1481888 RepID=A0AAU9IAW9_9CILI|nr:unnamed protein product [Blepharisma stoltei]